MLTYLLEPTDECLCIESWLYLRYAEKYIEPLMLIVSGNARVDI